MAAIKTWTGASWLLAKSYRLGVMDRYAVSGGVKVKLEIVRTVVPVSPMRASLRRDWMPFGVQYQ